MFFQHFIIKEKQRHCWEKKVEAFLLELDEHFLGCSQFFEKEERKRGMEDSSFYIIFFLPFTFPSFFFYLELIQLKSLLEQKYERGEWKTFLFISLSSTDLDDLVICFNMLYIYIFLPGKPYVCMNVFSFSTGQHEPGGSC